MSATRQFPPPGTVSKILWHFTGGPGWNARTHRQEQRRKSEDAAYDALLKILAAKHVKVGNYREVMRVRVPELRKYDHRQSRSVELLNRIVELESAPVCCLADIPVAHLSYHARRCGKIALGFHRDAAIREGFHPVFYTWHEALSLHAISEALAQLGIIDTEEIKSLLSGMDDLTCERGHVIDMTTGAQYEVECEADHIGKGITKVNHALQAFIAFVKTFDTRDFATIHCEREWRSTGPLRLGYDDVAMIILPKGAGTGSSFQHFTSGEAATLGIPRTTPVVPWDYLPLAVTVAI